MLEVIILACLLRAEADAKALIDQAEAGLDLAAGGADAERNALSVQLCHNQALHVEAFGRQHQRLIPEIFRAQFGLLCQRTCRMDRRHDAGRRQLCAGKQDPQR